MFVAIAMLFWFTGITQHAYTCMTKAEGGSSLVLEDNEMAMEVTRE
jgi:hypothetical protein